MSQQRKLTYYFGKRKRIARDEAILRTKKILLDDNLTCNYATCNDKNKSEQKNGYVNEENNKFKTGIDTCSHTIIYKGDGCFEAPVEKPEDALTEICNDGDYSSKANDSSKSNVLYSPPVAFMFMGSLSPVKKNNNLSASVKQVSTQQNIDQLPTTPEKPVQNMDKNIYKEVIGVTNKCSTDEIIKTAKELVNRLKRSQIKMSNTKQANIRKELSLKEVKDKLKQGAKLNELRKSINKISEQAAVLIELENKKKENSVPKLSKFKAIEVDVPLSPQKNALYSPSKVKGSPAKPAYERFNFLAEASTNLPLPFSFQKLYELFRAVDTISSMMINRGEDVTFHKLKPAVQEMTRKTFTLRHLAQMATVLPSAFNFHQEKVRNFGSTSKTDKYELVITPTFPDNSQGRDQEGTEKDYVFQNSVRMSMTPKIIKARREAFYNALLDKTKDCHEEFLKSLDPPMQINRSDLKRWHPNFLVDHVPDIIPKELPELPNNERPATAKEVLERAKDFLSSNARLQKALESASQSSDESIDITSRISPAIKEEVDSRLCNPLKGISKSLLERVRARQFCTYSLSRIHSAYHSDDIPNHSPSLRLLANGLEHRQNDMRSESEIKCKYKAAKALDSMRMTPEQEKESIMYTRLPAIARIVRTLYVNEQRGVLSWETVLEKVQFSYNRNLSKGEVESHVKLLVELLPEWLSVVHIRNSNYLKMNPAAELTLVMTKLDKIVSEKAKNS